MLGRPGQIVFLAMIYSIGRNLSMPTRSNDRHIRKWVVVGLLSLGIVIAYVDRANLSVVLTLKDFRQLFHLSDADRGLLNSAFFWSYALLQIPAGWIVDRYGVKVPYAVGFLCWTVFSALTAFVQTTGQLIGLRFLLGCGESIVGPASLRWIRFNCKEQERAPLPCLPAAASPSRRSIPGIASSARNHGSLPRYAG